LKSGGAGLFSVTIPQFAQREVPVVKENQNYQPPHGDGLESFQM